MAAALVRLDGEHRARLMLQLQRAHGNAAVRRLLDGVGAVQRQGPHAPGRGANGGAARNAPGTGTNQVAAPGIGRVTFAPEAPVLFLEGRPRAPVPGQWHPPTDRHNATATFPVELGAEGHIHVRVAITWDIGQEHHPTPEYFGGNLRFGPVEATNHHWVWEAVSRGPVNLGPNVSFSTTSGGDTPGYALGMVLQWQATGSHQVTPPGISITSGSGTGGATTVSVSLGGYARTWNVSEIRTFPSSLFFRLRVAPAPQPPPSPEQQLPAVQLAGGRTTTVTFARGDRRITNDGMAQLLAVRDAMRRGHISAATITLTPTALRGGRSPAGSDTGRNLALARDQVAAVQQALQDLLADTRLDFSRGPAEFADDPRGEQSVTVTWVGDVGDRPPGAGDGDGAPAGD